MGNDFFDLLLLDNKIEAGENFNCANARNKFVSILKSSGYKDLMQDSKGYESLKFLEENADKELGLIILLRPKINIFFVEGRRPENDLDQKEREVFYECRRIIDLIFKQL
ncbi:MAG: hypothetical protein Q7J86_08810 [Bacteroidota bacterium]|nr:hypothetical protein [Bacteroidota bacterium]